MQPLDARSVTYGDTTFHIGKLMPIEAKRVFMSHVRPMLQGALAANVAEGAGGWQVMLAAVTNAPQEHYDALTAVLYTAITYTKPNLSTAAPLANDLDNAFDGLDMVHILDLELRAFCVNFLGSWDALKSMYPQVNRIGDLLTRQTSTLSSGTQ